MCHRVQGDSVAKRQPQLRVFVGVVGVVTSGVPCARVRGRTSRSCATENTHRFRNIAELVVLHLVLVRVSVSASSALLRRSCRTC